MNDTTLKIRVKVSNVRVYDCKPPQKYVPVTCSVLYEFFYWFGKIYTLSLIETIINYFSFYLSRVVVKSVDNFQQSTTGD